MDTLVCADGVVSAKDRRRAGGGSVAKLSDQERGVIEHLRKLSAEVREQQGRFGLIGIVVGTADGIVELIDRLAQEPSCEGCIHEGTHFNDTCYDCDRRRAYRPDRYERQEADHV